MADDSQDLVIDMETALTYVGGDRSLLAEIAQSFLAEVPQQLQCVRDQIEASDAIGIQKAAHKIRGSFVIFSAKRATNAAQRVEDSAKIEDTSGLTLAMELLEQEMELLLAEVQELCKD